MANTLRRGPCVSLYIMLIVLLKFGPKPRASTAWLMAEKEHLSKAFSMSKKSISPPLSFGSSFMYDSTRFTSAVASCMIECGTNPFCVSLTNS